MNRNCFFKHMTNNTVKRREMQNKLYWNSFFHIQYWQNYKNSITDYWQYSRIGKLHSSLLKSSHCTSILSLIQLTFLLPMLWTHFLVNYLFLFHCFVFQGFLSFPWEQILCLFSLLSLPLCIQVKPLHTSYVGASLYRLHVSDAFRGTVGFDVDKFRLSLGCAVSSPLGGGCGWRWGLELAPGMGQDSPSAQWPSLPF